MKMSVLFFLFIGACARLNQAEQDNFRENKRLRHGIEPVTATTEDRPVPEDLSNASVARGKALYEKNCLACHGPTGLGDGPQARNQATAVPNLQKTVREVRNFRFFLSISEWQGTMPGWKRAYDEDERADLVAYLKTFR